MADQNQKSKKPTYGAYHAPDTPNGKKVFWTRIGVAWAHEDGKGFNITLDCVPVNGRMVLRTIDLKADQEAQS